MTDKTTASRCALAAPYFRLGYHGWLYYLTHKRIYAEGLGVTLRQEAEAVWKAAKEADELGRACNLGFVAASLVVEYLEPHEKRSRFMEGSLGGAYRMLDQTMRKDQSDANKSFFRAGAACAGWEANRIISRGHSGRGDTKELRQRLREAGLRAQEINKFLGVAEARDTVLGVLREPIMNWLEGYMPNYRKRVLMRIRAQHAEGLFPEESLLTTAGCSPAGVEYLRHLHKIQCLVTDLEIAREFGLTENAIAQRRRNIPRDILKILLEGGGPAGGKGNCWRDAKP